MKNKEDFDFTCPCEGIKKVVIAMCDIGPGHSNISAGSLPCVTLRALMHEEFPYFNEASAASGTNCSCPECGSIICTCNWGFDNSQWASHDDSPRWMSNRLDGAPTKYME